MIVKELIKELEKMPSEAPIYKIEGAGLSSVKLITSFNLKGVIQFCELRFFDDKEHHTEDMLDELIRRQTGFKNREGLIEAYLDLKKKEQEYLGDSKCS